MHALGHIIDGVESESSNKERFVSVDPWTREPWCDVALGHSTDVDRAVAAARRAFDDGPWPRMGFDERGRALHRLADLIDENASELGLAETRDMGKPIKQSEREMIRASYNLRFFADHARMAVGETLPSSTGHHAYTRFEPAGVVAAIAPWNFPLMLETWKVAPALAWGNTVVLKPAEQTPTSATLLGRLAIKAGIPRGVLNVVHGFGPGSTGQSLTEHHGVDRITFTGESATGRAIARAAASNLVPVSLELGGKGANLIFSDSELDKAVDWSVQAAFANAGEVCLAGSRIYVQREIYERFLASFVSAAEALLVGDPKERGTDVGPLASEEHFGKVRDYVDTAQADGGTVCTGGIGDGWVVRPTVVTDLPPSARHIREEVFGPFVTVTPFESEDEAIRLANSSRYGLNAMVFSDNLNRAHRVAARLNAGTIWVNCFFIRDLRAPFGGVGDSGIGREGGYFSRDFFTEPKAVVVEIDNEG